MGGDITKGTIEIIIPILNEERNLRRLLPALRSQKIALDYKITVIDSESTDASVAIARQYGCKVVTVRQRDFDHGKTRQEAAANSDCEFVVFLVADALPANDLFLHNLVAPMLEDNCVAGCYGTEYPYPGIDYNPVYIGATFLGKRGVSTADNPGLTVKSNSNWGGMSALERRNYAYFNNRYSCIRRKVLETIPLRKSRYAEDCVWAHKAIEAGYRIVFNPKAVCYHYHKDTPLYIWSKMVNEQYESLINGYGPRVESVRKLFSSYLKMLADSAAIIAHCHNRSLGNKMKWLSINSLHLLVSQLARFATYKSYRLSSLNGGRMMYLIERFLRNAIRHP